MKRRSKSLKINADTNEGIQAYAAAIRTLLKRYKVPKTAWSEIWMNLDDYPDADCDLDLQWFIGWFRGVADALDVTEQDLVKL